MRPRHHQTVDEGTQEGQTSAPASSSTTSDSFLLWLLFVSIVLHVAFPKAGFKIGPVPVTVADIVFALLLVALFYGQKRVSRFRPIRKCSRLLLIGIVFFAFRIFIEASLTTRSLTAEDLAKLVPLCVYPLIFFAISRLVSLPRQMIQLNRLVAVSVVVLLFYGIAQKALGEYAVLVPGVTANWHDARIPDFLADKSNLLHETGAIKLTSTYQNGNLLGVNLLLLLPIAAAALKRKFARLFVMGGGIFVLVFTASRATWFGTAILALLSVHFAVKRITLKFFLAAALTVAVSVFVFFAPIAQYRILGAPPEEVAGWSGRLLGASILWNELIEGGDILPFLVGTFGEGRESIAAQGGGADEMFYLAVFELAGVPGLLVWVAPVAFSLGTFYKYRTDTIIRAVLVGLVTWCCVAVAEGAFWLPPTAFNLWTVIGIGWLRVQALARSTQHARSTTYAHHAAKTSGLILRAQH